VKTKNYEQFNTSTDVGITTMIHLPTAIGVVPL